MMESSDEDSSRPQSSAEQRFVLDCHNNDLQAIDATLAQKPDSASCRRKRLANLKRGIHPVFHLAVYRNHRELAETLLKAGADPNAKGEDGKSALDMMWEGAAVLGRSYDSNGMLVLLEGQNGTANKYTNRPQTCEELEFIRKLERMEWFNIQKHLDLLDPITRKRFATLDDFKDTPVLHLTIGDRKENQDASREKVAIVEELLNAGAQPNAKCRGGKTALDWLWEKWNISFGENVIQIIKLFEQNGGEPAVFKDMKNKPQNSEDLEFILDCFSFNDGHQHMFVRKTLAASSDDKKERLANLMNSEGIHVLHNALDRKQIELVKLLLESGADPNVKSGQMSSKVTVTALEFVVANGYYWLELPPAELHDIIELLRRYKAHVSQENSGLVKVHQKWHLSYIAIQSLMDQGFAIDIQWLDRNYFHQDKWDVEYKQQNKLTQKCMFEVFMTSLCLITGKRICLQQNELQRLIERVKENVSMNVYDQSEIIRILQNCQQNKALVRFLAMHFLGKTEFQMDDLAVFSARNNLLGIGLAHLLNSTCLQESLHSLNPSLLWNAVNTQSLTTLQFLRKVMLDRYLDSLKLGPDGTSPLHLSLQNGDNKIIEILEEIILLNGEKQVFGLISEYARFDYQIHMEVLLTKLQVPITESQWKLLFAIAKAAGSKIVLDWITTRTNWNMGEDLAESGIQTISELVELSYEFPAFNDDTELPYRARTLTLKDNIVEVCQRDWPRDENGKLYQELSMFNCECPIKCSHLDSHREKTSPWSCQAILDLLFLGTLLSRFLKEKSTLRAMGPNLHLIGSVMENTRIGAGTETDSCCMFENIHGKCFETGPNAFNLQLSSFGLEHFKKNKWDRFIKNKVQLNYIALLRELLEQLHAGLVAIKDKLPSRMSFNLDYVYENCKTGDCKPLEDPNTLDGFHQIVHCTQCLPATTHTKLGPCIITQWRQNDTSEPVNLTMDVIPVLYNSSSTLDLFKHQITTLLNITPLHWKKTLTSYLERDRILPEAMYRKELINREHGNNSQVAMKIQHFGPENNTLLRPGQTVGVSGLHGNIRDLYIMTKIWKAYFPQDPSEKSQIKLKSFMAKKVLLDPARRERALKDKAGAWRELMNGPLKEFAIGSMPIAEYERELEFFLEQCK